MRVLAEHLCGLALLTPQCIHRAGEFLPVEQQLTEARMSPDELLVRNGRIWNVMTELT